MSVILLNIRKRRFGPGDERTVARDSGVALFRTATLGLSGKRPKIVIFKEIFKVTT